jgi:Family of unknown function (DUF6279)
MRARRVGLFFVLLALLASCSALRLSYDHADWVLARMAGNYVDMDREQARALKAQLAQFHAWHRREELPRYAALLDQAAARLERGLTRDDVVWAVGAVRGRYQVLGREAADGLAPLLLTLNDRQLDGLEARFAADNRKYYAAKQPKDPEDAVRARAEWICARLEDWTGEITQPQRGRVVSLVRAFPDVPALRLADRKRRQAQLLVVLREHANDPDGQAELVAVLADPDAGRSERYRATLAAWEASFIDAMVELDRSLTSRQRATAVGRMRRYAEEFRDMAGNPRLEARGSTHEAERAKVAAERSTTGGEVR